MRTCNVIFCLIGRRLTLELPHVHLADDRLHAFTGAPAHCVSAHFRCRIEDEAAR